MPCRWAFVLALLLLLPWPRPAAAADVPDFAALEAAGARVGRIRVVTDDIFDLDDPRENGALFRWANALHVRTRAQTVRRSLLFHTGEPLSADRILETERLLRQSPYLHDVRITPVDWHDGVVDIDVNTRDTWSLDPGLSVGRAGGANSSGIQLREYNLLGTGTALSIGHAKTVDRASDTFQFNSEQLFGERLTLRIGTARNTDGRRDEIALLRPFHARDARHSAGISVLHDDRIDTQYAAGLPVSALRHNERRADVFFGWSEGLRQGWVRRLTLGAALQDDRYAPATGSAPPALLPDDDKRVATYLRWEWIEDRVQRAENRRLMARPEFFDHGLAASLQLGWATAALGSSRESWLLDASVSRGFEPAPEHMLLLSAGLSGRVVGGRGSAWHASTQAELYVPQADAWLFVVSASADALAAPVANETLALGGDNGLRGYPLRYQNGSRRALLTLEERVFTEPYLWRLFRFGAAAFVDVGRAWGGDAANRVNPGWLADVGLGLRIVSTRAAFGNVVHVDVAHPLRATADMRRLQFLVKAKASF